MSFEKQTHLQSNYSDDSYGDLYYYGRVVDNNDPLDSHRIRVRVKGLDDKYSDADLPWCEAFSPMFLSIVPQKDELVRIIPQNWTQPLMRRQWVGPIISSVQTLNHESYLTALSNNDTSTQTPNKAITKIPSAAGAYPALNEIAIQGRDNTDIILKEKEILIRAGKFVYNDNTTLNKDNPSYIKLKLTSDGKTSYAGMVADKIFLITHQGAQGFDRIVDDKTLLEIFEKASPAVLGDYLYDLLAMIVEFLITHIHPPELPPNAGSPKFKEISEYPLKSILSNFIRIN